MRKSRTIIQPVSDEGLIAPPQILVEKSVWQQMVGVIWEMTKNIFALIGLFTVIGWLLS